MQYLSVLGNLGADAEVRVSNDKKFVSFKVADTQSFTDQKGVKHDRTTWVTCALNGDGGNLLTFLKKGTKVLVQGRPSYRVYSSEKERSMMAGVDLHVISIELAGGSSDVVPRRLVDPNTGALVEVSKHFWVSGYASCRLIGERGGSFLVDANGFVVPEQAEQAAAEARAADAAETAAADSVPFTEATEKAAKVATKKNANAKK